MEAPPVLLHSSLYRSFIIVLGKLLYEYLPKSAGVLLIQLSDGFGFAHQRSAACAAASLAIGTRNGEQET